MPGAGDYVGTHSSQRRLLFHPQALEGTVPPEAPQPPPSHHRPHSGKRMKLLQRKGLLWGACGFLTNLAVLWALWSWGRWWGWWQVDEDSALAPGSFWRTGCPLESLWNREWREMAWRLGAEGGGGGRNGLCRPDLEVADTFVDFQHLPQQMQDFLLYRHCRWYPLLLEPRGLCRGPGEVKLLLAVKSQAASFDRRQAIRQTWGAGRHRGVRLLFLLGRQGHPELSGLLGCESRLHGDLLQWAFLDTFFNLTLKEVLFLAWLGHRCPGARYIFKGDDDTFVNTGGLLDYLSGLGQVQGLDLFVGDLIVGGRPSRNASLKYYVPGAFYSGLYPPYAGGAGVLYSGLLARRLARVSRSVPLFPIDDVYTGMCLRRLGLSPVHHPGFCSFGLSPNVTDPWDPCVYRHLLVVHQRSPQEIIRLWRLLHHPNISCQPGPSALSPEWGCN
ncbi:N-acetyllactosaminide beta-1,3-N-acetylglucosaminyltransferase 2-like [Chiloscyllium plagiosum]|uniref:N-acetyllactosaminide beta-1,3-N-acetylglucosaminyltransferase 2-like n=1 Tax=Chiloscyllium plagiosum TaxID=36176 RepID=UPI001CB83CE0|nr:N-acetyllactosaminide beta-1,3-N-acetylglucosaminyltransferase 2-like [Chiloscyllium plagiosum]